MRDQRVFILVFMLLVFCNCSGRPSESDMKKVFEKNFHWYRQANEETEMKIKSFRKTKAQDQELFGLQTYITQYEAEVEFLEDCWEPVMWDIGSKSVVHCLREKPAKQGSSSFFPVSFQKRKKGEIRKLSGEIKFEKTARGWRGPDRSLP